jgi:hypothetical protein
MNYAVALGSLTLFVVGFRFARIVPMAADALVRARNAVSVLADNRRTEEEKERAAREASMALFGRFFAILLLTAAALVPSALLLLVAVQAGIADEATVMDAFVSPWLIAAAIALFVGDYVVRR